MAFEFKDEVFSELMARKVGAIFIGGRTIIKEEDLDAVTDKIPITLWNFLQYRQSESTLSLDKNKFYNFVTTPHEEPKNKIKFSQYNNIRDNFLEVLSDYDSAVTVDEEKITITTAHMDNIYQFLPLQLNCRFVNSGNDDEHILFHYDVPAFYEHYTGTFPDQYPDTSYVPETLVGFLNLHTKWEWECDKNACVVLQEDVPEEKLMRELTNLFKVSPILVPYEKTSKIQLLNAVRIYKVLYAREQKKILNGMTMNEKVKADHDVHIACETIPTNEMIVFAYKTRLSDECKINVDVREENGFYSVTEQKKNTGNMFLVYKFFFDALFENEDAHRKIVFDYKRILIPQDVLTLMGETHFAHFPSVMPHYYARKIKLVNFLDCEMTKQGYYSSSTWDCTTQVFYLSLFNDFVVSVMENFMLNTLLEYFPELGVEGVRDVFIRKDENANLVLERTDEIYIRIWEVKHKLPRNIESVKCDVNQHLNILGIQNIVAEYFTGYFASDTPPEE